jgi:hypothetical protein
MEMKDWPDELKNPKALNVICELNMMSTVISYVGLEAKLVSTNSNPKSEEILEKKV